MEQSIKRLEDLPGYRIEGAVMEHGRIYLKLSCDMHVVFGIEQDAVNEGTVQLVEPDVVELARHGFITFDQLRYELREETAAGNWIRVKELADAAEALEDREVSDADTD